MKQLDIASTCPSVNLSVQKHILQNIRTLYSKMLLICYTYAFETSQKRLSFSATFYFRGALNTEGSRIKTNFWQALLPVLFVPCYILLMFSGKGPGKSKEGGES